ncbi:group II intron maturase-specific domain-containing protein [Myroides odoratus]|uniref:Group II intron maturase-specific domain-containing protein n=1 Tax=Myroides odoratus TaxID=256 RepID=A0A9Q6Z772_MYROD|nr:hypothetical protein I6I88_07305 [Myroides odoratus]
MVKIIEDLGLWLNPTLQGWINYYWKFYKTDLYGLFN